MSIPTRWAVVALASIALSACSGTDDEKSALIGSGVNSTGQFTLEPVAPLNLSEGSLDGVNIPIILNRRNSHNKTVSLSIEGANDEDERLISFNTNPAQLDGTQSVSTINVVLAIDDLPISTQQRTFFVNASDGEDSASIAVEIDVQPVNAPEVYLLVGQSNMVGFSGDGTKLAGVGGPDEPNPRIKQLNVSKNDESEVFTSEAAFTSIASNVIVSKRVVEAEDPLHIPLDPSNTSGKDLSYIGLGLSFAKEAVKNTQNDVVLVPAAWSGSSFCLNEDSPGGQWNAQATANPDLGNTWLFDRAVVRANLALTETGGILRGILWHQGESDAKDRCAGVYLANLERLAQELRVQIDPDRRGTELRRANANIPFVLGTMSRGIDERDDLSVFYAEKQLIDDAHRILPSKIDHTALTISDDLTPENGYPCGNTSCIHYGAEALRVMGQRYYDALRRAAVNP